MIFVLYLTLPNLLERGDAPYGILDTMILTALPKQFSLKDEGVIFFQPDATNPLPGQPIARVEKGETLLQPRVVLLESAALGTEDSAAVLDHLQTWLKAHIFTVLEPLFTLVTDEGLVGPVREIALKLFSGVGILPRGDVENLIETLDQEARRTLRSKKVKMGPLLLFLPDLNKPAAVRLRALLWCLTNDQPLPAPVPRDGAMSVLVDPVSRNPDFYRAIGYPLFGPRAIRIDMLDRVISAIYDKAKDGKFQAQHAMAEWMGCPIADLYGVLEAMGHRHIVSESVKPESAPTEEDAASDSSVIPQAEEAVVTQNSDSSEAPAEPTPPQKPVQKKPELDWFLLRRGKAHADKKEQQPRARREDPTKVAVVVANGEKPSPFPAERYGPKKSFKAKSEDGEGKPSSFKKKRDENNADKGRERSSHRGDKHDDRSARSSEPRVFSAAASTVDNPFAVLQSLKLK
jgi:ATP-dependent RNA helicase SUPV3L1/SUV3